MKFLLKILGPLGAVVSIFGELLPLIKSFVDFVRNNPKVKDLCPQCIGKGSILIPIRPDRSPDPMDYWGKCPMCEGKGSLKPIQ